MATLNLLHPSRMNPRITAEEMLNLTFDYKNTPVAPPGTNMVVHRQPKNKKTRDPQGAYGWHLGIAP